MSGQWTRDDDSHWNELLKSWPKRRQNFDLNDVAVAIPLHRRRFLVERFQALDAGDPRAYDTAMGEAKGDYDKALFTMERLNHPKVAMVNESNVTPLPGGLTWAHIQEAYASVGGRATSRRYRRRRPGVPSRAEVAHELNVAPKTLERACVAAGKGPHWPPADILTT